MSDSTKNIFLIYLPKLLFMKTIDEEETTESEKKYEQSISRLNFFLDENFQKSTGFLKLLKKGPLIILIYFKIAINAQQKLWEKMSNDQKKVIKFQFSCQISIF